LYPRTRKISKFDEFYTLTRPESLSKEYSFLSFIRGLKSADCCDFKLNKLPKGKSATRLKQIYELVSPALILNSNVLNT